MPLIISLCAFTITSCSTIFYGKSTDFTIDTPNGVTNNVNIVAIGTEKVIELKDVSLPYKIKVKRKDLPLHVKVYSDSLVYKSFDTPISSKGFGLGMTGFFTSCIATPFTTIMSSNPVTISLLFASGVAMGWSSLNLAGNGANFLTQDLYKIEPDYKSTIEKYTNQDSWERSSYINEIYRMIDSNDNLQAMALTNWLMSQEASGELYYLRGMIHWENDKLKKAQKDLKLALNFIDSNNNPYLYDNAYSAYKNVSNARNFKKAERARKWKEVGLGLVQTGAAVYQAYAQNEYYKDLGNSGIAPNGVVTDPTRLSQTQLNQLIDPRFAAQQVMQKEYMEYQEFCRFNKKEDGSNYTFQEFQAFKGEALLRLKEEGIDLVAEQREMNRQANQEWREELEQDRKDRLEKAKAVIRGEAYTGTSSTSSTASSTSTTSSTSTVTTSTPVVSTPVLNTNNTEEEKEKEKLDSKQQFKNDPVSSEDYKKVKNVTLYKRDGNKARVMMNNVELCRKGAYYYIKIGNTYYPRSSSGWQKFRNAIIYGHEALYYND